MCLYDGDCDNNVNNMEVTLENKFTFFVCFNKKNAPFQIQSARMIMIAVKKFSLILPREINKKLNKVKNTIKTLIKIDFRHLPER